MVKRYYNSKGEAVYVPMYKEVVEDYEVVDVYDNDVDYMSEIIEAVEIVSTRMKNSN